VIITMNINHRLLSYQGHRDSCRNISLFYIGKWAKEFVETKLTHRQVLKYNHPSASIGIGSKTLHRYQNLQMFNSLT
jgi:hypothetical protein